MAAITPAATVDPSEGTAGPTVAAAALLGALPPGKGRLGMSLHFFEFTSFNDGDTWTYNGLLPTDSWWSGGSGAATNVCNPVITSSQTSDGQTQIVVTLNTGGNNGVTGMLILVG